MTCKIEVFAACAMAAVLAFLPPAPAHAQEGISELSPAELNQALVQYTPGSLQSTWAPAAQAPVQDASAASRTVESDGSKAHLMPLAPSSRDSALTQPAADNGPLTYHGGPVMQPSVTIYPIFWVPAKLQTGGSTSMSSHYQAVQYSMLSSILSHGLTAIATQYYQKSGSTVSYVQNKGGVGAAYVDTSAYPASGCKDAATPGNCLSDAQLRAEVQKVMNFAKLTGGLNKIFVLYTSSGEGSCLGSSCSYQQFCAYHSYYKNGTTPVIYANEPFGTTNGCQVQGAPSPNGDPAADAASTSASHELNEAITDPLLTAWFTAQGNENGDLCAYKYGPLSWDGGRANQMWNGNFFLLQTEFDNHAGGCYQVGP